MEMEFKLKNKPIAIAGKRNKLLTPFGYEVNRWFEGFGKEAQEIVSAFNGWWRVYRSELSKNALSDFEDHLKKLKELLEEE